jgi:hypothetical protein
VIGKRWRLLVLDPHTPSVISARIDRLPPFAWNDVDENAIASIIGAVGGKRVKARRIAP